MRRALPVAALAALLGCAPAGPSRTPTEARDTAGLQAAERSVAGPTPAAADRPAMVVAGVPVGFERLAPLLGEAAGAQIAEEVALDVLLEARARQLGLSVRKDDLEAERRALADALQFNAEGPARQADEVIAQLRRSRGLGPARFDALLARNALLRQIAAPAVAVTSEQVDQAMQVRWGERRTARIIVVSSAQQAGGIASRLREGEASTLAARFAQEAAVVSSDPSSVRGGLLEPISPVDPAYPAALRSTLAGMAPGELGPVVALDRGFAVVMLDRIEPAQTPPADARVRTERVVRLRAERVAMDRVARDLLQAAGITVFDPAVRWSWEGRTQSGER